MILTSTKWTINMLIMRRINTELLCVSKDRTVRRAIPQGGVISSLLWLQIAYSLLTKLEISEVIAMMYADDIAIQVQGKIFK